MLEIVPDVVEAVLGAVGAFSIAGSYWGYKRLLNSKVKDKYESFINDMVDGYYRSSLDGKQLTANPALVRLNGYETKEEMLAGVKDIAVEWYVDPERRAEFARLLKRDGQVNRFRSEIYRHKTRERIWISESARLVCDSSGRPDYYEGTVREVTDTMRRLELESSYRKYSENVPGVLFQASWGADGTFKIPFKSRGFDELVGELDGCVEQDAAFLYRMVHEADYSSFVNSALTSVQTSSPWILEFRIDRKDGSQVWIDLKATPTVQSDGSCIWHGFMMDITDRKNSEQRVHRLAYYDPLTELPNRRLLLECLKRDLANVRENQAFGAVMFIDLDNFKTLNDTRGHGRGDQLLQHMSRRLEECVGDLGLVGRFGGDEFVILLHDLGKDECEARKKASSLATCALEAVDRPCELKDGAFQTSCSIGVAMFGSEDGRSYEILRFADTAMYAAKDNGKNGVCFYEQAMQDQLDQSVTMMSDLRDALANDDLALHYQMQVKANGEVSGAEALLRWFHPKKGCISPDQFIPLAEETGVIIPVTEWVLREAFLTLERWQADENLCNLKLSINISARQFHEPNFVQEIVELIEKHRIDPSRLVLEMTEHVLNHDTPLVRDVMRALKEIGVGFSLDDFGTGYSSLVHMRELPFDEIKIDGKFVSELESNASDRAIVRSIIAMAEALELETVAEWVETSAQQEILREEGCTVLQGYLFSPPLPLDEFEAGVSKPILNSKQIKQGAPIWQEDMVAEIA